MNLRSHFKGVCAASALMLASTASAQEAIDYEWEGPYIGAFLAGAFFEVELSDLTDNITNDSPATNAVVPAGGINGGYNWIPRDDNLMLGIELEIQGGHATDQIVRFNSAGTSGRLYESKIQSLTSVKGRVGMINDNLMVYISGGPTFATVDYVAKLLEAGSPDDCAELICAETSEQLIGLTTGVGMEYVIRDQTTLRFEITHFDIPTASATLQSRRDVDVCSQAAADDCTAFFASGSTQIQFGINYSF